MSRITVISMGPGDPSLLTLQAADALRSGEKLVLRTCRHPVADWLSEQDVEWSTLDALYDRYDDFDRMHTAMAKKLWKLAEEGPISFAVPDGGNDGAVDALRRLKPTEGELIVLPGVSRMDSCMAAAPVGATDGLRVIPAMSLDKAALQPALPLLITELDNAQLAGDVKLFLTELYDDELEVTLFTSSVTGDGTPVTIPLWELDHRQEWDHTVSLLLPPSAVTERKRFCFDDLVWIMRTLRAPGGCSWDMEQTHESLRRYLIEEAWEVVSAIDEEDPDHLADELGDVLLQVVFHADIGRCHGTFAIGDVTTAICEKMLRRHPHVFGDDTDMSAEKWDAIKKQERGMESLTDMLEDIPGSLPSLMRMTKVLKRCDPAAKESFTEAGLMAALKERMTSMSDLTEAELTGLLTDLLRLCRLKDLEPELLLGRAANRMIRQFEQAEKQIKSEGKVLQDLTKAELHVYLHGAHPEEL